MILNNLLLLYNNAGGFKQLDLSEFIIKVSTTEFIEYTCC